MQRLCWICGASSFLKLCLGDLLHAFQTLQAAGGLLSFFENLPATEIKSARNPGSSKCLPLSSGLTFEAPRYPLTMTPECAPARASSGWAADRLRARAASAFLLCLQNRVKGLSRGDSKSLVNIMSDIKGPYAQQATFTVLQGSWTTIAYQMCLWSWLTMALWWLWSQPLPGSTCLFLLEAISLCRLCWTVPRRASATHLWTSQSCCLALCWRDMK